MSGFFDALVLLTRVPARRRVSHEASMGRSLPWFPVIGALVGLVVAGVYALGRVLWPAELAAAVAIGAGVAVTGALHEDGLADTADTLGASDREDALRILRDPRHGSYGVVAIVASVLVRSFALSAHGAAAATSALVAAHALSRGATVVALRMSTPARHDGLGAAYARRATTGRALAAGLIALVAAAAAMSLWGVVAAGAAAPLAYATVRGATRRIGGMTGDVLGALEQVVECSVLLAAAALDVAGCCHPAWWR